MEIVNTLQLVEWSAFMGLNLRIIRPVRVGNEVRALRESRGLSTEEVAVRALGPQSRETDRASFKNYLSRVELGKQPAGMAMLLKIARGLGYSEDPKSLSDFFLALSRQTNADSVNAVPSDIVGGAPITQGRTHGPDTPVPAATLKVLSDACIEAGKHVNRGVARRLLAELAFAFGMAANPHADARAHLVDNINKHIG